MNSQINPWDTLEHIASEIPEECRENIVIIGSLAAAFGSMGRDDKMGVRTKDVDCMVIPYSVAKDKAEEITKELFDAGWTQTPDRPKGNDRTPKNELPAVRLYPPGVTPEDENAWFIELLTEPESEER